MGDALAPWHIIILVVVLVVLFGSRRLPGAAQSLGQSMHIFKKSVSGLHDEDPATSAAAGTGPVSMPPPLIAAPVADPTAQALADLQRQVADLQRQNTSTGGQASEAQSTPSL
jgi:sec-independent protein translocase protein TatA